MRGMVADQKSPLAYGYDGSDLPVYFNQAPVLNAGGGGSAGFGGFGGGGAAIPGVARTSRRTRSRCASSRSTRPARARLAAPARRPADEAAQMRAMVAQFGVDGRRLAAARGAVVLAEPRRPAAVGHAGRRAGPHGQGGTAGRPVGKGHVVMFAIRPFWRWQTQGTYSLGFNAIMNWNDLDAGKVDGKAPATAGQ